MLKKCFERRHAANRRMLPRVEELEPRLAPATLVNSATLTFQDVDGDNVTVRLSRPLLPSLSVAGNVFVFNTGGVNQSNGTPQQLQAINFDALPTTQAIEANGVSVVITATRSPKTGGDGFVNVGVLNAAGLNLGSVVIRGDLGQIDAGDSSPTTPALLSLTVQSLGLFGTSTQGSTKPSLLSNITGNVGAINVTSDIDGGDLQVTGAIGTVKVGGSSSGEIDTSGNIGVVTIGKDLVGTSLQGSGEIFSAGAIGSVTVFGSLLGGPGDDSALISAHGNLGTAVVGGDVRGGAGLGSGEITSQIGNMGTTVIDGSLVGSSGAASGALFSLGAPKGGGGSMGPVVIKGHVEGGSGADSGEIDSGATLVSLMVGGSILGGDGSESGEVLSGGAIGPVSIGGDLQGGGNTDTGSIQAGGNMGAVTIAGNLQGGTGSGSGSITIHGNLASALVGGSVIGTSSQQTGLINILGNAGTVTVKGDLLGGTATSTGEISAAGSLAAVTVTGSVVGGPTNFSGVIFSAGDLGSLVIGGSLLGGSISGAPLGPVSATGYVQGLRIASVLVKGSIVSGFDNAIDGAVLSQTGSIRAVNDIGPITVDGSLEGNEENPVILSARGQAVVPSSAVRDLALARVTVLGRVDEADILAGYNVDGVPVNGNASIGAVFVGQDWIASSVAAGVETNDGTFTFGEPTDHEIGAEGSPDLISSIASIIIQGQALGNPAVSGPSVHFGFVAEEVGFLSVGGTNLGLKPGPHNDQGVPVGATGDLTVFEVA